jgi:hypothetical protein
MTRWTGSGLLAILASAAWISCGDDDDGIGSGDDADLACEALDAEIDLPEKLTDVWVAGPDRAYAVGSASLASEAPHPIQTEGVILAFDGTGWTAEDDGDARGIAAVHGSPGGGIWAMAGGWGGDEIGTWWISTLLRRDDGVWTEAGGWLDLRFVDLWVAPDGAVFAAGFATHLWGGTVSCGGSWVVRFDGGQWSFVMEDENGPAVLAVTGTSSDDVLVATDSEILRFDGVSWTEEDAPSGARSLFALPSGQVFAAGEDGALRFDGEAWSALPAFPDPWFEATGIWAASWDEIFVTGGSGDTGGSGVLRLTGDAWVPEWSDRPLRSVHGVPGGPIFAAGGASHALIRAWDGSDWLDALDAEPRPLLDVAGDPGWLLVAAGQGGFVLESEGGPGGPWVSCGAAALAGVGDLYALAARPGEIWAAGAGGAVLRRDASGWEAVDGPGSADLLDAWVGESGVLFVLDAGGVVSRRDAAGAWTDWSLGAGAIHGSGAEGAVAVGAGCLARRFDGSDWQDLDCDTGDELVSVWAASAETFFAGTRGAVLRRDASGWATLATGGGNEPVLGLGGRAAIDVFGLGQPSEDMGVTVLHSAGEAFVPVFTSTQARYAATWLDPDGPELLLAGTIWWETGVLMRLSCQ